MLPAPCDHYNPYTAAMEEIPPHPDHLADIDHVAFPPSTFRPAESSMLTASIKRIGAYFVAGALAVLPLVITVGVVVWAVGFLSEILGPDAITGQGYCKAPECN